MIEYTDLILKCNSLFHKLNGRALLHNMVEGNVCFSHPFTASSQLDVDSHPKRFNLWRLARNRNHIMEIGFNAGHSSLIMLLSNRDALLTIFDLEKHVYTRPCFELLQNFFPHMRAHYGDSKQTVSAFTRDNPNARYDLIHIDGAHEFETLEHDYQNAKTLSHKDTVIVVDDTDGPIGKYIQEKVLMGEIVMLNRIEHRLKKTPHHMIFKFKGR